MASSISVVPLWLCVAVLHVCIIKFSGHCLGHCPGHHWKDTRLFKTSFVEETGLFKLALPRGQLVVRTGPVALVHRSQQRLRVQVPPHRPQAVNSPHCAAQWAMQVAC